MSYEFFHFQIVEFDALNDRLEEIGEIFTDSHLRNNLL